VDFVEAHSRLVEHLPGYSCFQHTRVGKWSIRPANKAIVTVPSRLAVTEKAELKGRVLIEAVVVATSLVLLGSFPLRWDPSGRQAVLKPTTEARLSACCASASYLHHV
jgi:hypothetical protein